MKIARKSRLVARKAVARLGLDAQIEKITNYDDIKKYPILATPGLVINEKLVCAGRIPSEAEVTTWLTTALEISRLSSCHPNLSFQQEHRACLKPSSQHPPA